MSPTAHLTDYRIRTELKLTLSLLFTHSFFVTQPSGPAWTSGVISWHHGNCCVECVSGETCPNHGTRTTQSYSEESVTQLLTWVCVLGRCYTNHFPIQKSIEKIWVFSWQGPSSLCWLLLLPPSLRSKVVFLGRHYLNICSSDLPQWDELTTGGSRSSCLWANMKGFLHREWGVYKL